MNIKFYLCTLMCAVILSSCQKDEDTKINQSNHLTFKDRNSFENAINSKDLSKFRTTNFKSLKETTNNLGIDNEFLQSVLSPSGEIQIGQWLFKLNGVDKTVKVLDPTTKSVTGNFTFDDDVLDLLENGITSTPSSNQRVSLFCGEQGVCCWHDETIQQYAQWNGWNMHYATNVLYQKWGVYFELNLRVLVATRDTESNILIVPNFEVPYIKYREYWYKAKCKNTQHGVADAWMQEPYDFNTGSIGAGEDAVGSFEKLYASTTALAKYKVYTLYTWENDALSPIEQVSNHGF